MIDTLEDYFTSFGRILEIEVLRFPNGDSRQFGYVTFNSQASANAVISEKHIIDGAQVRVKYANPKPNTRPLIADLVELHVGGISPNTREGIPKKKNNLSHTSFSHFI